MYLCGTFILTLMLHNMDEAQYVIERHKMSRSQIRSFKKRPHFRGNVIEDAIESGESYKEILGR